MSTEPVARREWLSLTAEDARLVDLLLEPGSDERAALEELATEKGEELGTSKAALLRAAFHLGVRDIRDLARDKGYQRLAASITRQESDEDRAITRSRRRRAAEADGG